MASNSCGGWGLGTRDVAPSFEDGQVHRGGEAEDMEKGQGTQHDFIAAEAREPSGNLLDLLAQVAVGEHDSLGDAGGASGILVHGHIVEIQSNLGRRDRRAFQQGFPPEEVVSRFDIGGQFLFFADQRE
jgi:hypothetical protein